MSRKTVPAFANSSLQKRFALAVRVVVLKVRNGYLGLMKTYVDIRGASGGAYRFQNVAALSKMPASAGNFVLVSDLVYSDAVTCCGSVLSLARAPLASISQDHGNLPVFVRLNISRSVRVSELEDIVARHRPNRVLAELDEAQSAAFLLGPGR